MRLLPTPHPKKLNLLRPLPGLQTTNASIKSPSSASTWLFQNKTRTRNNPRPGVNNKQPRPPATNPSSLNNQLPKETTTAAAIIIITR
ncbi:RING-10 finger domain-containing protein [Histoplasma capsulatum G186AR]|uniref:RING-10 finger domain-containing protein n=1 Tax=Ajellomyces capsulatus TaxID=5037 RepID=A0A8H7Z8T0_AJECA|nr:RING-10 finger domain-containing protein [Histoplasma capsulatum]QSS70244.1 RING-10 finger domain-containing protein [Histoplasma capsulatum G186AR]